MTISSLDTYASQTIYFPSTRMIYNSISNQVMLASFSILLSLFDHYHGLVTSDKLCEQNVQPWA